MSLLEYRKHLPQNTTAFAKSHLIKSSVYKLKLVADAVKGTKASDALLKLEFYNKKVANDIGQVLRSAISNAENNFSLDIDSLYISEILINKSFFLKRYRPKSKGRAGKIRKPYSKVVVFVTAKSI